MGVLHELVAHPAAQQFLGLGLPVQIVIAFLGFIAVSVALNVAQQILIKNPNEPPLVFHWIPFIGSTITYGMDPPTFFRENREKVRYQITLGSKSRGKDVQQQLGGVG